MEGLDLNLATFSVREGHDPKSCRPEGHLRWGLPPLRARCLGINVLVETKYDRGESSAEKDVSRYRRGLDGDEKEG